MNVRKDENCESVRFIVWKTWTEMESSSNYMIFLKLKITQTTKQSIPTLLFICLKCINYLWKTKCFCLHIELNRAGMGGSGWCFWRVIDCDLLFVWSVSMTSAGVFYGTCSVGLASKKKTLKRVCRQQSFSSYFQSRRCEIK